MTPVWPPKTPIEFVVKRVCAGETVDKVEEWIAFLLKKDICELRHVKSLSKEIWKMLATKASLIYFPVRISLRFVLPLIRQTGAFKMPN